jgi:hypothetical protein
MDSRLFDELLYIGYIDRDLSYFEEKHLDYRDRLITAIKEFVAEGKALTDAYKKEQGIKLNK